MRSKFRTTSIWYQSIQNYKKTKCVERASWRVVQSRTDMHWLGVRTWDNLMYLTESGIAAFLWCSKDANQSFKHSFHPPATWSKSEHKLSNHVLGVTIKGENCYYSWSTIYLKTKLTKLILHFLKSNPVIYFCSSGNEPTYLIH